MSTLETRSNPVVIRLKQAGALRPFDVVMTVLAVGTLAGCALLLSAVESPPIDGAIEWSAESPLRAVVQLLCLNYAFPTIHAGDVKGLVLGLGTGFALLALSIGLLIKKQVGDGDVELAATGSGPINETSTQSDPGGKVHISPLRASQIMFALYILWSFASYGWSRAPQLAIGGSMLLTISLLWSFALGFGLKGRSARLVASGFMIVLVAAALLAIWYYYGRNPNLRAKFPSGNPTFLAEMLLTGLTLLAGSVLEQLSPGVRRRQWKRLLLLVAGLGLTGWAFRLADSRGAMVGVVFALVAMLFFAMRGRLRVIPAALAVLLAIAGYAYYSRSSATPSAGGRDASARVREYAWSYAWNMFESRSLVGHGQGGFVLAGDARCIDTSESKPVSDVMADAAVFESRLANAHNEWLQVLADLGSIGFVLVASALQLTIRAGMRALDADPSSSNRWLLIGALGGLVGLCVAECFGVGLRVSDVPPFFYSTLGLVWALSSSVEDRTNSWPRVGSWPRILVAIVGIMAGAGVLATSQQDFSASRNAFQIDQKLEEGDFAEAARLGQHATSNLNPDRALANRYRLARAHWRAAVELQKRAEDREVRAQSAEIFDQRLAAMATQDRADSERHVLEGFAALNDLVHWSPNYFNAGRVGFGLNIIQARSAAARGDQAERDRFLREAATALEREMQRQPFDPAIAAEFARIASGNIAWPRVFEILARPLRHNRISGQYLDILSGISSMPEFEEQFAPIRAAAEAAVSSIPSNAQTGTAAPEIWAPEILRLDGAIRFTKGGFAEARRLLGQASRGYERASGLPTIGALSGLAELADSMFFHEPLNSQAAIETARKALAIAPPSLPGRQISATIKQRMIDYSLAAGDEPMARQLLRELALVRVQDADIDRELGVRYARMTYSLLERPAAGILRQPATELRPTMKAWIARARELSPDDQMTHFVSADIAFHEGDESATAEHLRNALRAGMNLEAAMDFLKIALSQKPESEPLLKLREEVIEKSAASGK